MSDYNYKIVRFFRNSGRRRIVRTGQSLAMAQAHCQDPQTSSSTCTNAQGKARTRKYGPWFDGYTT